MENNMTPSKAKKAIKGYIGQFGALFTVFVWLSALAALILGGLGFYFAHNTECFNSTYSRKDSRAFIEAVAISDWVYKYEEGSEVKVYYTVADPENYLYIVSMDPKEFEKLAVQNERWNGSSADDIPEIHRLYGTVQEFIPVVLSDLADVWDRSDDEDFVKYFGDRYLDVKSASSKGTHFPLLLAGAFFGLVFIGLLLSSLPAAFRSDAAIKELKRQGLLQQAAAELEAEDGSSEDLGSCIATRNFLFGRGTGTALPYKDILWFYQSGKGTGKNAHRRIIVNTADKQNVIAAALDAATADQVTQRLTNRILTCNPNALFGPGKEMRDLYRELCSKYKKQA